MTDTIKSHYSAAELAAMTLPDLPATDRGVKFAAERENWAFQKRSGRGGGVEYAFTSLPPAAQAAIKRRVAQTVLSQPPVPQSPAQVAEQLPLPGLTDTQQLTADCRKAVLIAVARIQRASGCSQEAALITLLTQAQAGELEPQLMRMLTLAKTKRGRQSSEVPGLRSLKRWLAAGKRNDLAPKRVQPDLSIPAWAKVFLAHYQQPQKPTVVEAYALFKADWGRDSDNAGRIAPSIHAVRRFLDKLPADLLCRGRHTGSALSALLPYVRRDWSKLKPNDVWIGDGHGMKAKVAHPDHGKPFVPEVTLIIDGASRKVMGWSVAYAENQIAVGDALRHAVIQHGKALIYYSDNGAGQTALALDDPNLGCLPRLGIHHETGIPGSPQGRGIIERIWQTLTIPLARQMPTFRGKGMDNQTLRKTTSEIESTLKRGETSAKLPTWDQFLDALALTIAEYNSEHEHRSLPRNPATGKHWTPAAYYAAHVDAAAIERPSEAELLDLFRPYVMRVVDRGWVRLWNNRYFAHALAAIENGTEVRVGYDIHDANQVVIRDAEGVFICMADWNGNSRAAFPVSQRDRLAEQRADRMTNRGLEIIDRADAERRKTYDAPAIEHQEVISIPGIKPIRRDELLNMPAEPIAATCIVPVSTALPPSDAADPAPPASQVVEMATYESRWDRWWRIDTEHRIGDSAGEFDSDGDRVFWRQYQKSPEFKARLNAEGVPGWVLERMEAVRGQ